MLTLSEKRKVGKLIRDRYEGAKNIRFENDGSVNVTVDQMPNTNQAGRIFAGWDADLLKECER